MTVPRDWEWLDGMPDEWEAPRELQDPTPYPEVNLAILLLSCDFLSFEVRAAIGHFIVEEAQYDMWFVENFETAGWGTKKSAQLREVPMEQARIIYEAWKALDAVNGLDAPNEALLQLRVGAIAGLMDALQKAAEEFLRIRAEYTPRS